MARVDGAPVRVRFDVAYDGTDFSGWARQPGLRTVQGSLEAALRGLYSSLGPMPNLVVAGRTDAGVHARGQVVHLDLTAEQVSKIEVSRIALSVNGMLGAPRDIVVQRTSRAHPGFDARFSALWRRYEYRIADTLPARSPLTRFTTAWTTKPLDLVAMQLASNELVGLHDWAAFCRPRAFATTIRTLQEFVWRRDDEGVVSATLQADAFCHSMVRALVGAVVAVGEGRLGIEEVLGLRDALERTSAFKVMPARGLTLLEVGYPDAAALAARAEETRARRSLFDAEHARAGAAADATADATAETVAVAVTEADSEADATAGPPGEPGGELAAAPEIG